MSFWKFKVKSDTVRVDSTGRARVDINALFAKAHVKNSLSTLRNTQRSGGERAVQGSRGGEIVGRGR